MDYGRLPKNEPLVLRLLRNALLIGLGLIFLLPGLTMLLLLLLEPVDAGTWGMAVTTLAIAGALTAGGAFIVRHAVRHWRSESRRIANQRRYPHEPWMWDRPAESFRASATTAIHRERPAGFWKFGFVLGGVFAGLLALVVGANVIGIIERLLRNDPDGSGAEFLVLPGLLFCAAFALFLVGNVGRRRARLRDQIELIPNSCPVWLGSPFSGIVRLPPGLPLAGQPQIEVLCVHDRIQNPRTKPIFSRQSRWQEHMRLPPFDTFGRDDAQWTLVPFSFEVPADQPSTDESDRTDCTSWRLRFRARVERFAIDEEFRLPIYQRPA